MEPCSGTGGIAPCTYTVETVWRRLVAGFPLRRPEFAAGSGQVEFVVDKVALGQVFFQYFGFPCQSSFHQMLHPHSNTGYVRTIGQKWPTCRVGPVWTQTPLCEFKKSFTAWNCL
jgi:hypothetical protein